MMYLTRYSSPLGELTLAADGQALTGLWIEGQKYFASTLREAHVEQPDLPVFALAARWLDDYFDGRKPGVSGLPLAPAGSAFRQAVWRILCAIPSGEVMTYGGIARRLGGSGMSAQAVGGAVGHNPISIIIPCHRVVGSNGSLTGYAGGLERKIRLLELEGADMSRFFVPGRGTAL